MNESLLLIGIVIVICLLINRLSEKLPIPSLLLFLMLGMLFGENGILEYPLIIITLQKSFVVLV